MKRYEVTMMYFRTVEVVAKNEKEAAKKAHAGEWDYDNGLEACPEEDEVEYLEEEDC